MMTGNIANTVAILLGGTLGLLLRKGIADRYKERIMQGIGLVVGLIGMKMALKVDNELIVILSMVIGAIIGEALEIEKLLNNLGNKIKSLVRTQEGGFVQGFISSSLIYCVGAMSIMGALESGLLGEHKILFAKATLDGIVSVILASSLGVGVLFSSVPVFIYQGAIVLLAGTIKGFLTDAIIMEMTATGGLLIMALAANMLGLKEFKVANLLPAIFIAVLLTYVATKWFPVLL